MIRKALIVLSLALLLFTLWGWLRSYTTGDTILYCTTDYVVSFVHNDGALTFAFVIGPHGTFLHEQRGNVTDITGPSAGLNWIRAKRVIYVAAPLGEIPDYVWMGVGGSYEIRSPIAERDFGPAHSAQWGDKPQRIRDAFRFDLDTAPNWTHVAVGLPTWVFVVGLALTSYLSLWNPLRKYRRRKRGECPRCGYDLTGNESGTCPECGRAIDRAAGRDATTSPGGHA